MSTVDNRIVQMEFDNGQFEQGVQTSIKSLDALKKSLKLDNASNGIATGLEDVGKKFSAMEIAAITSIQRITNSAISLGTTLVKSLSIDQVTSGWTKYNQKTTSVQTIMNATGKSIEEVNTYLDELMWFSDETSYGFTDMTRSLGQLTASGGKVEKLIPMIEGIANATAFAGKGTTEFSRAIYNLNQSYGAGNLQYMDWRSLELAGIASEQLKQQFIDVGIALGKIKKGEVTVANFGTTLQKKWATTEVMEQAFGNFAEMTQKAYAMVQAGEVETASEAYEILAKQYDGVSITAAKAAQEAKTFGEAITATKDAVSSGWMKTFELIFGNYQEAKVMWTDLADGLWEVFASGAKDRNELLSQWNELGGRADLIQGVTDALSGLNDILKIIKGSMAQVFPEIEAEDLLKVSTKIKEAGARFKEFIGYFEYGRYSFKENSEDPISETAENIEESMGDLDRVLKKGSKGEDVKDLQERLIKLGYLDEGTADGIYGPKTQEAVKKLQKDTGLAIDGIYGKMTHAKLGEKLSEEIGKAGPKVKRELETFFGTSSNVFQNVGDIAKGVAASISILGKAFGFVWDVAKIGLKAISPLLNAFLSFGAAIGRCLVSLNDFLSGSEFLNKALESIKTFISPITTFFSDIGGKISSFFGETSEADKASGKIQTFGQLWDKIKISVKESKSFEVLSGAFDKVKTSVKKVVPIFKSWYTSFKQNMGERFNKLLGKTADFVPKAVDKISGLFTNMLEWISPIIEKMPDWLSKVGDFFSGIWESIGASEKINKAWTWVKKLFTSIFDDISNLFTGDGKDLLKNTSKFFADFWEEFKKNETFGSVATFLENIWKKIEPVWDKISDFFVSLWDDITGIFNKEQSSFDNIGEYFDGLWKSFKESEIFSWIATWLEEQYNKLKNNDIFAPIIDWFSDKFDSIKTLFTGFISDIGSIFSGEGTENPFEKTSEWLKNSWNTIKTTFSTIFDDINTILFGGENVEGRTDTDGWGMPMVVDSMLLGAEETTEKASAFSEKFSSTWEKIKETATKVFGWVSEVFGIFKSPEFMSFATGVISAISIIAITRGVTATLRSFQDMLGNVTKVSEGLVEVKQAQTQNQASEIQFKKLLAVIGIIAELAAAIIIIGKMPKNEFKQGAIAVGIISAAVVALMLISGISKGKSNDNMKNLGEVLTGFAASIASMVAAILLFSKLDLSSSSAKGFLGLIALLGILALFVGISSKLTKGSGGKLDIGAKLEGLKGAALAIIELTYAIEKLAKMKPGDFIKGFLMLSAVMVAFGIFMKSLNKSGTASGGSYASLTAVVLSLGLLMLLISGISKMKFSSMAKGILGMGAVMLVFALFVKSLSKSSAGMNVKGVISALVSALVIAGLMIVFAETLKSIKDVDAGKIAAFGGSIAAILAAMALLAHSGFIGSLGGIIGAALGIGIVIAAFAGLNKIPGFKDFMKGGAEDIGEVIGGFFGSLAGAFQASRIKTLNNGLKDLSDVEIDQNKLDNVLAAAKSIQKFSSGFPQLSWPEQLVGAIFGDEFTIFCKNVGTFAENLATLQTVIGTYDFSEENAQKVSDLTAFVQPIKDLSDACNANNLEISDAKWIADAIFGDKFSTFCDNIGSFGANVFELYTALEASGITDVESTELQSQIDKVIEFITPLKTLSDDLNKPENYISFNEGNGGFGAWLLDTGIGNKFTQFNANIGSFGTAVKNLYESLTGETGINNVSTEELTSITEKAITFIDPIKKLSDGFAEKEMEGIKTGKAAIIGKSFTLFCKNIGTFGGNVASLATDLSKLTEDDVRALTDVTPIAIEAAEQVKELASAEVFQGSYTFSESVATVLGGTKFGNFCADMGKFGISASTFAAGVSYLADYPNLETDTGRAITAAEQIKEFIEGFKESGIENEAGWLGQFFDGKNKTSSFFDYLSMFGEAIGGFSTSVIGIDDSIKPKAQIAADAMRPLASFFQELATMNIENASLNSMEFTTHTTSFIKYMGEISSMLAQLNLDTVDIDVDRFSKIAEAIKNIAYSFGTFAINKLDSVDPEAIKSKIQEVVNTLANIDFGDSEKDNVSDTIGDIGSETSKINTSSLTKTANALSKLAIAFDAFSSVNLGKIDSAAISEKIGEISSAVTSSDIDTSSFGTIGEGMGSSLVGGFNAGGLKDKVSSACKSAAAAARSYQSSFNNAGYYLGAGLVTGAKSGASGLGSAMELIVKQAIERAKEAGEIQSPSKATYRIGKFLDLGLVNGVKDYGHLISDASASSVEEAIKSTSSVIAGIAAVMESGADFDPVIRPVVDMSNVNDSAKAIGGLFNGQNTISVSGESSNRLARTIRMNRASNLQNGSANTSGVSGGASDYSSVNLSGNNFYIRSEEDIRSLAFEISALNKRMAFGRGSR